MSWYIMMLVMAYSCPTYQVMLVHYGVCNGHFGVMSWYIIVLVMTILVHFAMNQDNYYYNFAYYNHITLTPNHKLMNKQTTVA